MYIIWLIILLLLILIYNNASLKVTTYKQFLDDLPEDLNGFNIVQIADLHNTSFGVNQKRLLKKIKFLNPDIVVFTGDLIDYNRFDEDIKKNSVPALELIKGLKDLNIPMYMVYGNHETKFKPDPDNHMFMKLVQTLGVKLLNSNYVEIHKGTNTLNLLGIHDPYMFIDNNKKEHRANNYSDLNKLHGNILNKELETLTSKIDNEALNILICHRPELLNVYSKYPIDIVLTGHAHGGQFRVPFIGGLYAPHQGKLPKYTSGVHTKNNTNLIISKGLGNSTFPIRLNNRPEIVNVSINKKR